MVEPMLSGIILGLIVVTLSGLFVAAFLQYKRSQQFNF
uniref:Cytochrome b6-f complex subunit 5 n=1 Tax=Bulboplastis apyrenoidosa TaxID=1070855 RepID=A0A1X9PTM2_9RHOD|nr:cytochrome b6f complex subunit 5 [Bulboplastis apyrenoidosa]ARO90709.1 cytochrome b6f complex subunit 5 [Bulboplastis apyrenoidosa]